MTPVHFKKREEILEKIEELFRVEKEKLEKLLPYSQIEHVGGTSIPNGITKGDLDINIRVEKENFDEAVSLLKEKYVINQPHNWNGSFASFKDDSRDLGIQLTVINSPDDCFVKQRDYLLQYPEKVMELNKLKESFEGVDMEEYRKTKSKFFESLIN
jgi:GrpB-like predicted nucleotidyltransferase (UPF0157 family)